MIPIVPPLFGRPGTVYSLTNLTNPFQDQDTGADTYEVRYIFRVTTDGTVDSTRGVGANINDDEIYATPPPGGTLYVRCTQNSGTSLNVGDSTGVWHPITTGTERSFGLNHITFGGPDLVVANIDLELATDSGGTNIVATKSSITFEVGQTA